MKRFIKGWLYAGMTVLAIPGANLVYGQASAQSSYQGAAPSPQGSGPAPTPIGPPVPFPHGAQPFPRGYESPQNTVNAPSPQTGYPSSYPQSTTRGSSQMPYQPAATSLPQGSQQLGSPAPRGSAQAFSYPLATGKTSDGAIGYITTPSGQLVPSDSGATAAPYAGTGLPGSIGAGPDGGGTGIGGAGTGAGATPGTASAPGAAAGPAAGAAPLFTEGTLAELGGLPGAGAQASFAPNMIGDQGPFPLASRFPPVPGPFPPGKPVPGSSPFSKFNHSVNAVVPAVRGFKIADNQSPRPMDRVFVDFNYYDNVNSALNRRLNAPIGNMQVYHELFGVEKTFFDGNASLGLRIPINSLSVDSSFPGLGGSHTAAGNLAVFGKYVLYQDDGGNLLSAGLSIDTPTGPASFAGVPVRSAQNAVGIQPFLGYILKGEQWFLQGFGSIDVPTASALPTMMYLDAGIGYFLYRTQEQRFLTAIIPTYELHMNIPLNHSGYSNTDFYGVPPVLDMTFGVNFGLFNSAYLTTAYVVPVTGPQPFSGEFALQFNWLFGRSRRAGLGQFPPPSIGG